MIFDNKFNSKKSDSLVEAVKEAQRDGDIRRQAVAHVNEEFGVYNRNGVVRENLAAYDARIEEAYKCMKEGKPLSPKQEKMAAIAGDPKKIDAADLSALRSGKKMNEKKMWEAKKLADKDYDKDGKVESPKDEVWGSRFRAAKAAGKMEEGAMDSDVVGGGAVTKDNKPVVSSTAPKADTSGPSAADKAGLAAKIGAMKEAKKMEEAVYSAKAARAGKDIGKPGKSFAMIAKKAGERYDSEEKGKKVAGAILAKIRAKHMKEEQSF
jgi:hypothetical protein